MEDKLSASLSAAQARDQDLQRHCDVFTAELENLETVNSRLSAMALKLRERQQAMTARIQELEKLASITPQLRQEIQGLIKQNEELVAELQGVEEANKNAEGQMSALRRLVEQLQKQPSHYESEVNRVNRDREVLQLLRSQNQRLVLELDEAKYEMEQLRQAAREAAGGQFKAFEERCRILRKENNELIAQFEVAQRSLAEKEQRIQLLEKEIKHSGDLADTPSESFR
jgi:chromosome segregation ATPase